MKIIPVPLAELSDTGAFRLSSQPANLNTAGLQAVGVPMASQAVDTKHAVKAINMNTRTMTSRFGPCFWLAVVCCVAAATVGPLRAAAPLSEPPKEADFEQSVTEWRSATDRSQRQEQAENRLFKRPLSSQQVKRLAAEIVDEDERIEFAVAAFPHVVDPENFYDVYDTFQTFSKVFRMHDRITALRRPQDPIPSAPPVIGRADPVTTEELAELVATLKKEAFDDGKLSKMRLIGRGLAGRITCKQTTELLECFAFDESRLECAKLSVDWVRDPRSVHQLVDAMKFLSSRDALTAYIETHNRQGGSRRPR